MRSKPRFSFWAEDFCWFAGAWEGCQGRDDPLFVSCEEVVPRKQVHLEPRLASLSAGGGSLAAKGPR